MTIPLNLDGAMLSQGALYEMVARRNLCFDHDHFYVRDGTGKIVQIEFQLSFFNAFHDPRYLPIGDDPDLHELVEELQRFCLVFIQPLDLLKPCEHPDLPAHRVLFLPDRQNRAEVFLQIPIFGIHMHYGSKQTRSGYVPFAKVTPEPGCFQTR